jgi:ubiquinone/menaquinone biosynthesis C-methylase UbiE
MTSSFKSPEAYLNYMGRWSRRLAVPFLEFAEIQNGDFILDAGTGTGSLAEALHELRPGCHLMGIDITESFVDYAKRQSSNPNFQFQVGSILEIPFEAGKFDKALALLVINFVNEPLKAALEMKRVTKPGGLVAAAVWDISGGMGMLDLFRRSVEATDPGKLPSTKTAYLCRPVALRELWQEAGFNDIKETTLEISTDFKNFDDFWNPILAGATPLSAYVSALSEEKRTILKNHLRGQLFHDGQDRPFSLPARAWALKGRP